VASRAGSRVDVGAPEGPPERPRDVSEYRDTRRVDTINGAPAEEVADPGVEPEGARATGTRR
jgi:hypothetical protein